MADTVTLLDPRKIDRNPENPRLIFRQDELDALEHSIKVQGILVPLTVYRSGNLTHLIDGERRWRCALKLGLHKVPVIIQPKPNRLQNLMMMFAIHHRRQDWDPLPTALKLQTLEDLFTKQHHRKPIETELAELGSLTRGEVRRLKKLLALPERYRKLLLEELDKPRSKQILTVDHVIESSSAAKAIRKAEIIKNDAEEGQLRDSLIDKFKNKIVDNTVAPRLLVRMARAVSRKELPTISAQKVVMRLTKEPKYTIQQAYDESTATIELDYSTALLADRLMQRLDNLAIKRFSPSPRLLQSLENLQSRIRKLISQ